MTSTLRLLPVAAAALTLASSSLAAPPRYVQHFAAFVTLVGHGRVESAPRGIDCPRVCRAAFLENSHLALRAVAAPGWRFVAFTGWCHARRPRCGFDLVSPHDCAGGACPIGAFGIRAIFARLEAG